MSGKPGAWVRQDLDCVVVDPAQQLLGEDVARGPVASHAPPVQHHDPVRPGRRHAQVVGNHHDRDARVGPVASHAHDQLLVMDVERGGRLVEEQDAGPLGQHSRQCRARALAT